MVVVPLESEPLGSRPSRPSTVVHWAGLGAHAGDEVEFGRLRLAVRATSGCDRIVPLTSTSIFGIVYDARPRNVVWNGSTSRQLRVSGLSMTPAVAQLSCTERPVLVPPEKVSPHRVRAFSVTSTPCQ